MCSALYKSNDEELLSVSQPTEKGNKEPQRTREQESSEIIFISIPAFYSHPRKDHSSNTSIKKI